MSRAIKRHIGLVVAAGALAASLILLAGGCGGEEGSTTQNGAGARSSTINTDTAAAGATSVKTTGIPQGPGAGGSPGDSRAPNSAALIIIDYSVDPDPVQAGAPLTCTVTVQGDATQVIMGLTGPSGSTPQTIHLMPGATEGGITTWSNVTTAPFTTGGWRFGATALAPDGSEVIPDAGGLSASLLPFEVIP